MKYARCHDALRIVYNKYNSIVSYAPTVAILLSPEVGLTPRV